MWMPLVSAACRTLVPGGTSTFRPSSVKEIMPSPPDQAARVAVLGRMLQMPAGHNPASTWAMYSRSK